MAERSFSVTVENLTGKQWRRSNLSLPHGEWSNEGGLVPPENIPPVSINTDGDAQPGVIFFEGESDGFLTGVEGYVDYTSDGVGTIKIHFDNPWAGGNTFTAVGPGSLRLDWGNASGNQASVTLTIRKR